MKSKDQFPYIKMLSLLVIAVFCWWRYFSLYMEHLPVNNSFLQRVDAACQAFTENLSHRIDIEPTVSSVRTNTENWGLSFQEEGKTPVANASMEELSPYNAYYAQNTKEKKIFLTFDCGYENGNTVKILDALKKHQAPATFFVVGNFLSDNPDLIKRMDREGHMIGNHTYHHPDMTQLTSEEDFKKELSSLEGIYQQILGKEMKKIYRPPQGKYSQDNLALANKLGYKTFFWSLAYVDWYENQQPSHEEAFKKLLGRIHPGAIVLLHNTSNTNGEILDELLTKWEDMGYTFHSLEEIAP